MFLILSTCLFYYHSIRQPNPTTLSIQQAAMVKMVEVLVEEMGAGLFVFLFVFVVALPLLQERDLSG